MKLKMKSVAMLMAVVFCVMHMSLSDDHHCFDKDDECESWATELNECELNPEFMLHECPKSCDVCGLSKTELENLIEELAREQEREIAEQEDNLLDIGDLDRMFRNIANNKIWKQGIKVHSQDPWVITIDNFMPEKETQRFIDYGTNHSEFRRSSDVGGINADGSTESLVSDHRTSSNTWCDDECTNDPIMKKTIQKIERLTGIGDEYAEHFQILQYFPGQYYRVHHDYLGHEYEMKQGVRVLTVFLYLNDVDDGGETAFPRLNITVQPRRGRLLIWPNVLSDAPDDLDERTDHAALKVNAGIKYACNLWIHQRVYKNYEEHDYEDETDDEGDEL